MSVTTKAPMSLASRIKNHALRNRAKEINLPLSGNASSAKIALNASIAQIISGAIFFTFALLFSTVPVMANDEEILSNHIDLVRMSRESYDFNPGDEGAISETGAIVQKVYSDPETGFSATVFLNPSDGSATVAFRGTEFSLSDPNDIITDANILRWSGDEDGQYANVREVMDTVSQQYSNVSVTGHSLGGSLAQYASLYSGAEATTFNSAPITTNQDALSHVIRPAGLYASGSSPFINPTSNITNISTARDPMTLFNNLLEAVEGGKDPLWVYNSFRRSIDPSYVTPTSTLQQARARTEALALVTSVKASNGFEVPLRNVLIGNRISLDVGLGHGIADLETHFDQNWGEPPELDLVDFLEYDVPLVPIYVNPNTSFPGSTVPQYGTIEQTIEFSAAPDSGNADLINEQVAVFVEEAEPETEPPVTTPLWAGRMSLTGRVNAGLNPATGVVGAMEASGDAPISEFILFNPETGTINTPLHGSQTSANIGHTFNHLIWGDWSGGSRTWTTSSYPVNQLSGFFVYGELTPPDARTTGTATYTGRLRGDIIENGNIHRSTAYGDFGLTANFSTGSLGGWLALADTDSSNYAFVSDIENARIVRQSDRLTFGGDLTGEGIYSGRIDGYFFGPNATELGGTYEVAGEDGNSSSSGILLGWETGTMPDRPDNPTSTNFPLYVSYSSMSGAIFDRGDDGIGKTPEMGDTLTLTIDGTPTRVTEVYDTTNDQFDYTSWGGWTGGAPSSPFNEGYWVAGQETPSSVIENLTGTATYSGDIRGDYVSAGTRHDATGNINLTADFSNDRITGDMMFHAQTGNGSVSAGTLGLQSDIRSDGSFFQSTSSHGFQGNFYGPNAEEAGGTAWLTTNDGGFNGVFRANQ